MWLSNFLLLQPKLANGGDKAAVTSYRPKKNARTRKSAENKRKPFERVLKLSDLSRALIFVPAISRLPNVSTVRVYSYYTESILDFERTALEAF